VLASAITGLGKTVLLVVAITFILWSLYTALVVPKRYPGFPRRLDLYIVLSAVLFLAQMTAVVWVTGTQEVEHEEAAETQPAETLPATVPSETEPAETTPSQSGDPEAGKEVFASAGCGSCHTLADADASGAVGPNLDETKPSVELVVDRVTNGKGVMQSFADQLDEQQIADVAAYVSSVAGASS
jgi:mono/diheme cytochrome c family protein